MFTPSRDDARQFFFDTWTGLQAGRPLEPMERLVAGVILEHPEYHPLLDRPDRNRSRDWIPEGGQTNPFLHLSLHVAIEEQLSIDQPPGIRAACERLTRSLGTAHEARHALLECLAETLWQAQRQGTPLDAAAYLDCVARR
ncbi:MAG: DUF1841 family protein [Betaproteobacteria bacterium]